MQRPSNAVLVLVLGIVSMVGGNILTAIPAWILGNSTLKAMDRGEMDPKDRGLAETGRILGIVMCSLVAVFIVVSLVFTLAVIPVLRNEEKRIIEQTVQGASGGLTK